MQFDHPSRARDKTFSFCVSNGMAATRDDGLQRELLKSVAYSWHFQCRMLRVQVDRNRTRESKYNELYNERLWYYTISGENIDVSRNPRLFELLNILKRQIRRLSNKRVREEIVMSRVVPLFLVFFFIIHFVAGANKIAFFFLLVVAWKRWVKKVILSSWKRVVKPKYGIYTEI